MKNFFGEKTESKYEFYWFQAIKARHLAMVRVNRVTFYSTMAFGM